MQSGRRVGAWSLATALVSAALVSLTATGGIAAPTDLFVADTHTVCDDAGPGSSALPFCSVQPALDVVLPGQTIHVAGSHSEQAVLRRSGTVAAPLTIVGTGFGNGQTEVLAGSVPGLTLSGVHDVVVEGMRIGSGSAVPLVVTASQRVTLRRLALQAITGLPAVALSADASSSDLRLERSGVGGPVVLSGTSAVTLTTNELNGQGDGAAVQATGVSGLAVTSNAIAVAPCGTAIDLAGVTTATMENNLVLGLPPATTTPCATGPTGVAVAPAAAPGTRMDYNAWFWLQGPTPTFRWAGTAYPDLAAFVAATGQAHHDLLPPSAGQPAQERSPLVDSADATAPGMLDVDFNGNPRVDDPLVADTGLGAGHADRGAMERMDQIAPNGTFAVLPLAQAVPFTETFTASGPAVSLWGLPVTYGVDWGDGSPPLTVAPGTPVTHTYTTPGARPLVISADDGAGTRVTRTAPLVIATAAAVAPSVAVAPSRHGGSVMPGRIDITEDSAAPFQVKTSGAAFLGSGGSFLPTLAGVGTLHYTTPLAALRTVTVTQTDVLRRTTTATAPVLTGSLFGFTGGAPDRGYDQVAGRTSIPAFGTVTVPVTSLGGAGAPVSAPPQSALLRVSVVKPPTNGFLKVGGDLDVATPTAPVQFQAGVTSSNLVVASLVSGSPNVLLTNDSSQPVQVVVDAYGTTSVGQPMTYVPDAPSRFLDTRSGLGSVKAPLAAHGTRVVQVAGVDGIPADAGAVLVDLTAVHPTAEGDLVASADGLATHGQGSIRLSPARTRISLAVVQLVNGKMLLTNTSAGTVDVTGEIVGHLVRGTDQAQFVPLPGQRLMDTSRGFAAPKVKVAAGGTVRVRVAGATGVPATGLTAAVVELGALNGTVPGLVTAYPTGTPAPDTANLLYDKAAGFTDLAVVPVGADGTITVLNRGPGPVDLTVDVHGYFFRY